MAQRRLRATATPQPPAFQKVRWTASQSSLLCEIAYALTLVLERAWWESEILPSPILTVVFVRELVIVEGTVHVGVVDQNGLTISGRWTIIADEENIRHHLTAELCLCSGPGFVECAAVLRCINKARRGKQIASISPDIQRTSCVIWRWTNVNEDRRVGI